MTFPMTIVDTVFKALAPAIPDRTIAGHHADLCVSFYTASIRGTADSLPPIWARSAAAGARNGARTACRPRCA